MNRFDKQDRFDKVKLSGLRRVSNPICTSYQHRQAVLSLHNILAANMIWFDLRMMPKGNFEPEEWISVMEMTDFQFYNSFCIANSLILTNGTYVLGNYLKPDLAGCRKILPSAGSELCRIGITAFHSTKWLRIC